jgi:hypothetical protein
MIKHERFPPIPHLVLVELDDGNIIGFGRVSGDE